MTMSRHRRSRRDERREETRSELLESAANVFAERGFHRASLEQIARDPGYTTGAIYWHFGGKDDLFLAVFESYVLTRVGEITEVNEQAPGDLPRRMRAFADQWITRQAADPRFLPAAIEFFVHALRHPELREALGTRHAAVRIAIGRMLEEEMRVAGLDLPMPAQDIATVLRELGVGLAQAKLLDPEAISDSLYGDFVELFFELALGRAREAAGGAVEETPEA
jgi:AcrR family transcriptional regulator